MDVKISGTVTVVIEGETQEFEVTDLSSLYSITNQIKRRINVDGYAIDFVEECVEVTKDSSDLVQGTVLAELFKQWVAKKGVSYTGGRNAVYRHVGCLYGVRRVTGTNKVGFRGIRIKNAEFDGIRLAADDLI